MHFPPFGAWLFTSIWRGRGCCGTDRNLLHAAPRIVAVQLAAAIGLASLAISSAQVAPPGAGVLLEEDFSFLSPSYMPNTIVPSGWDTDRSGGQLAYAYHAWFKMNDTSATQPVGLKKTFARQTSGMLVWEFRFRLPVKTDGVAFQLWNGGAPALSIQTVSGALQFVPAGGSATTLQTYNANQEYGVRLECNLAAQTVTVLVDGTKHIDAMPISCSGLDRAAVTTSTAGTGELFVGTVRILKDYLVYDRFVGSRTGIEPQNWTISAGSGSATVQRFASAMLPDTLSIKLVDTGTTSNAKTVLRKTIATQTGKVAYECKFLLPEKVDYMTWEMRCGGFTVAKVRTAGGNLGYVNNLGLDVSLIQNYRANFWYHLKVVIDPNTDTSDIWFNGKQLANDVPNEGALSGIDEIMLHTPSYGKGDMWLDDILVYAVPNDPSDPVPAPVVTDASPGYDVGVQNCSLWREGHHLGWDRINPFVERKPLLGWYDEGSPEVADWEIKWMVEHGIDFQMFCWFRPAAGIGQPVKDPYAAHALHDGFFQARHSNYMKFAIAWENNAPSVAGSTDFRNNVIPYWIEYYFKDPRYLKPGNKPIVAIYSFTGLQRDFGSLQNINAELEELRRQCVEAGFAGVTLLTNYNGTSTTELSNRKTAGFDYIFAYNWSERSQFVGHQQAQMTAQRDANLIDLIPTLGMGREDGPWGGYKLGFLSPAVYGGLASWARNTFMPSLPAGKLGRSLVLLDNWNEFGEGHFLMPSELAGFGYLDAVRSAFGGTTSTHSDLSPTPAQLARINTLYPPGRVVERTAINLVREPGFEGSVIKCGSWNATLELSSEAREGLQGLKVTKQNYNGSVGFSVPLRNQREYYLSAWAKSPTGSPSQTVTLVLEYWVGAEKKQRTIGTTPVLSTSQWTKVSGTYAIAEATEITNAQAFVISSAASGTPFLLDDIEVSLNGNLISDDPGFEGTRTGCTTWSATATVSSDYSYSGTQSLKITGTAAYGSVYWPIRPTTGRIYNYSAMVRGNPGAPAGQSATIAIDYLVNDNTTRTAKIVKNLPITSSGFTQISGTCAIVETGTVHSVRTFLYLSPPGPGTFYIDDIDVH